MAISSHISTSEGETTLLACAGFELPSVDITWIKDGTTVLSNLSHIFVSEQDIVQGKRLMHQSFLQICNVGVADAGTYTCIVNNGETSVNSSIEFTVSSKH